MLSGFPDAHFDWIYVDADHSYEGLLRDANAAATKVKPGGFLVFNDFAHADPFLGAYGVQRAVADFVQSLADCLARLSCQRALRYCAQAAGRAIRQE